MNKVRKYGAEPYRVALLHGGPGGAGAMEPVANELSKSFGVLEPIQNGKSVKAQVEELKLVLEENAGGPIVLAGHSWGAWLAFILAAEHPALVKKLVLLSAGPFEEKYAARIAERRVARLKEQERDEYFRLLKALELPGRAGKNALLDRLGELAGKADMFDPLLPQPASTPALELTENPGEIFASVWPQAAAMRKSGELLALASRIACPVIALHGDSDSHPVEGVKEPLEKALKNFRMVVLEKCGHTPWLEKQATGPFYRALINLAKP